MLYHFLVQFLLTTTALGCDGCTSRSDEGHIVMTRKVRRMQPDAQNATGMPRAPLEWGQLNFLHTTDTHGWLEGHIKEQNYGADWGDFVSFSKRMKDKAKGYNVDLLLIDTGDLHDGAGLSDASDPNGNLSNPVFENVDYDLLTIGNHELYVTEITYETFNQFSKVYGDKYLTSNVEIKNPSTGDYEYIGEKYRYFTTEHGLRIMSFGIIFDFTGSSNVSRVTNASTLVNQTWFMDAVKTSDPVDLFLVIGHNPPRPSAETSTFGIIHETIRKLRPQTPIQVFGGHTHERDFVVYDETSTGLESGRYCETLGWLSMSGIQSSTFNGTKNPCNVPNPTRPAIAYNATNANQTSTASYGPSSTSSGLTYARRYLDWNRLTFAYHSTKAFDILKGKGVSKDIYDIRQDLNLSNLYGCAPETYCQYCQPFGAPGNIFTLLSAALSQTVVNETRANNPRLIIINTGSVRFDLVKGPFTYDDSFIVSPFKDGFQFLPDVPYKDAKQVLGILNAGPFQKRDLSTSDFAFSALTDRDICADPPITHGDLSSRSPAGQIIRRQSTDTSPGYTTTDDFGTDGDDTPHTPIRHFDQPNDLQANASFPTDGSDPDKVDMIFLDFIASYVTNALNSIGGNYSDDDPTYYLPQDFTTNSYLPAYAKKAWRKNVPNCPVGEGVGSDS